MSKAIPVMISTHRDLMEGSPEKAHSNLIVKNDFGYLIIMACSASGKPDPPRQSSPRER
jgi:hypothetical protein